MRPACRGWLFLYVKSNFHNSCLCRCAPAGLLLKTRCGVLTWFSKGLGSFQQIFCQLNGRNSLRHCIMVWRVAKDLPSNNQQAGNNRQSTEAPCAVGVIKRHHHQNSRIKCQCQPCRNGGTRHGEGCCRNSTRFNALPQFDLTQDNKGPCAQNAN